MYMVCSVAVFFFCSLCCQCGTPIESNPSNTCVACLSTQVDITEGLSKQSLVIFCKGCERYAHLRIGEFTGNWKVNLLQYNTCIMYVRTL